MPEAVALLIATSPGLAILLVYLLGPRDTGKVTGKWSGE